MKNFIQFLIGVAFVIGAFFFIGPFYQKIVVGGDFNFSNMFLGVGLLLIGMGVGIWNEAYHGIDNEGQFTGIFIGKVTTGIGFIISLSAFLTSCFN